MSNALHGVRDLLSLAKSLVVSGNYTDAIRTPFQCCLPSELRPGFAKLADEIQCLQIAGPMFGVNWFASPVQDSVEAPPVKTAQTGGRGCRPRDRVIRRIRKVGRRHWKKESGYHQHPCAENTFMRYKLMLGERLHARDGDAQVVEADRSRAGMWVAEHTPEDFRVLTGFGCPSFYCERFVFDYSGLNMTGNVGISHLLDTEHPEVLILCPFRTGIEPADYVPRPGYIVVECFETAWRTYDFYPVVMVRKDVAHRLH